jgi:hypothetical protein
MKYFNPISGLGFIPLGDDTEFKKEQKLIEESDFLSKIVNIGTDLLFDEYTCAKTEAAKESNDSFTNLFSKLTKKETELCMQYQMFPEAMLKNLNVKNSEKLSAGIIYIFNLKQVAVYSDVELEGIPKSEAESIKLEDIKDKHRRILIDKFYEFEKINEITLVNILYCTIKYFLNVRAEFELNQKLQ